MPSASAKLEKQASFEASDSSKQILNVLEKKVRNLEKRKAKLDAYRQDDSEGKALNEDQKNAIKKYDEVIQSLEFAKELQKSFTGIVQDVSNMMAKAHKKQVKREQVERQGQEIQRLREMLVIQDVLNNMGLEHVRSCFLSGQHGAPLLTEENLNQLDEIYKFISPSRETEEGEPSYEDQLTQSSEHLLALSEGKNKEVLGTTYKDLKELILKIHECGFLNNPAAHQSGTTNGDEDVEEAVEAESKPEFNNDEPEEDYNDEEQPPVAEIMNSRANVESIPATNIIGEDDIAASQQRLPVHQGAGQQQGENYLVAPYNNNNNNNATASAAAARSSSSEFNFLQESQIDMDSPHMDPAVVVAHPMPSVPAMNYSPSSTENVPGYQSQHLLEESVLQGNSSTLPSTQFSQTSSTSTAAAQPTAQSLHGQQVPIGQPEFNQPIPSQTFTNQKFVTMQGMNSNGPTAFPGQPMYSQMDQTMAAQMSQNVVPGNLTPPSTDAGNVQGSLPLTNQVVGNEPKKHFMNANAVAFDTLNFKQNSGTMSSSPTPDASGSNNNTLQLSLTNNQTGHFTSTQPNSQQQLHSSPTSDLPSNDGSWNAKSQSPGSYPHPVTQQPGNFQPRGGFNGRGGRGSRGGRFGNGGGRGSNNFGGGRGGSNYQNYRENQGYFQNNFNRENYSGGQNNYSNGYKRGGTNNLGARGGGNARGGPRGNTNRGGNMRGGGGRGGFNKNNNQAQQQAQ